MSSCPPCVYECRVSHTRVAPKHHAFIYRVFLISIDMDNFPKTLLLSKNRFNLFSIHDQDHIHTDSAKGIRENLLEWLAAQGIGIPEHSHIRLITFPRVLGYSFNPVSFYYLSAPSGEPLCAVAEVTNTYREMKLYPIPFLEKGKWEAMLPKNFYVSPFSNPNDTFHFRLGSPEATWKISIDNLTEKTPTLFSSILGERKKLSTARLAWFAFKYPFLSLFIIIAIHFHALLLFLKKIPHFPKSTPLSS